MSYSHRRFTLAAAQIIPNSVNRTTFRVFAAASVDQ
jgi:hypothetical protein